MTFTVKFARIGRKGPKTEDFEASSADHLAEQIFRWIRKAKMLASKDFEVTVYGDGTGSIEQGRFGTFTWEASA